MLKLGRLLILILIAPLAFALFFELVVCLERYRGNPRPDLFLVGLFGVGLGYAFIRLSRQGRQDRRIGEAFVHELAHMLMIFLTLGWVLEFTVKDTGSGGTSPKRRSENFLSILAPYYLPTFAIPFIVAGLFIRGNLLKYVGLLIGATLAYHFVQFVFDFWLSIKASLQRLPDENAPIPDTKRVGALFAFFFCSAVNALTFVFVLNIVYGAERRVIWHHLVNGVFRGIDYYKRIATFVGGMLS